MHCIFLGHRHPLSGQTTLSLQISYIYLQRMLHGIVPRPFPIGNCVFHFKALSIYLKGTAATSCHSMAIYFGTCFLHFTSCVAWPSSVTVEGAATPPTMKWMPNLNRPSSRPWPNEDQSMNSCSSLYPSSRTVTGSERMSVWGADNESGWDPKGRVLKRWETEKLFL